ncbi:unannotated protein [freshwater metagenome]|uniref:Unannotated protein n=1 Tax=freshwater metagenome TaxID=449393 RepID=A0A6J6YGI2_9ZZZZ
MFVERDELAKNSRGELRGNDGGAGPVAGEHPVRRLLGRCAVGDHFGFGLAESQRLGLSEHVGHQQIVMIAMRVIGVRETDHVHRHQPGALMNQLIEGVLAVGPGLAPYDGSGLTHYRRAIAAHRLAVAFHVELLQIGGEPTELVGIGQHRVALRAQHVAVPDTKHRQNDGHVLSQRRMQEVLVNGVKPGKELGEGIGPNCEHQRQTDR